MSEAVKFRAVVLDHTEGLIFEDIINIGHVEGKKVFKTHEPVFVWDILQSFRTNRIVLVIGDRKPMVSRGVGEVAEGKTEPS